MSGVPEGLILAIDTASDAGSLAIERNGELLAEQRWQAEHTVSLVLLEQLDGFLQRASIARDELAAIAICVGPGGYGGLRAGIATAQGLALALDVPLAAVSRLEADAWPQLRAAPAGRAVVAVHDAGRAGLAWAAYACPADDGPPEELVEPSITSPEECAERAPAGAVWWGELTEPLLSARGDHNREADENGSNDEHTRAAAMLDLARLHRAYGDPAAVDAVYLRPPPITRPT